MHVLYVSLQAKAFALLSEEGIAKGVRRIVAVTADDAAAAIAEGQALAQQVEQAAALPDAQLEKVRWVCSQSPLTTACLAHCIFCYVAAVSVFILVFFSHQHFLHPVLFDVVFAFVLLFRLLSP